MTDFGKNLRTKLRIGCALMACAFSSSVFAAGYSDNAVKIGLSSDFTSVYSGFMGPGALVAARMGIEDFGSLTVNGAKIELLVADDQSSESGGAAASKLLYERGADVIIGTAATSAALAMMDNAVKFKRLAFIVGAASTPITNERCTPYSVHWMYDSYGVLVGTAKTLVEQNNLKKWFILTADYAFGHSITADAKKFIESAGGQVVGMKTHDYPASDLSEELKAAIDSDAQVIGLANAGQDAVNAIRQAKGFNLEQKGKTMAPLVIWSNDIHQVGLEAAQGMFVTEGFYWDQDEKSRRFSHRFYQRYGRMPTSAQAAVYSGVLHYLKSVQKAGTDEADKAIDMVKKTRVNDDIIQNGEIRADGKLVKPMYLMQVKTPAESRFPWDYYKIIKVIPGNEAAIPLSESKCPLVTGKK